MKFGYQVRIVYDPKTFTNDLFLAYRASITAFRTSSRRPSFLSTGRIASATQLSTRRSNGRAGE